MVRLSMSAGDGGGTGNKRKRKRKRKKPVGTTVPVESKPAGLDAPAAGAEAREAKVEAKVDIEEDDDDDDDDDANISLPPPDSIPAVSFPSSTTTASPATAAEVAAAAVRNKQLLGDIKINVPRFSREEAITLGVTEDNEDEEDDAPDFGLPKSKVDGALPSLSDVGKGLGALPLPDIIDVVKKKKAPKPVNSRPIRQLIDRNNISAFNKLLEVEPNADMDASFFEGEEYGVVSALLGEGAEKFLGVPLPTLQIAHTIGALACLLMASVEYPGFPLTDLPGPVRGALGGGLGVTYSINAVLAGLALFKAGERGQPAALWFVKTLTVGGLAFDQLTQLPTLQQLEAQGKMKKKKGKKRR